VWVNIFEDECIFFFKNFSELSQHHDMKIPRELGSHEDIFSSNFENIFMNHDDIFKDDYIFFFKNFFRVESTYLGSHEDIFSSNFENIFRVESTS